MRASVVYDEIYDAIHRVPSVSPRLRSTCPFWTPPHCPHPPNIIDPYFPAAMRQLPRDPVPRRYFSFLTRDLGCPNSPSVSSRASTIPFPSPVAWRGAERAGRGNFFRRQDERIDGVRMTNSHRNRHAERRLFLSRRKFGKDS